MDPTLADEYLWRIASHPADQLDSHISAYPPRATDPDPQGSQQQLHDGNKQLHHKLPP